MTSSGTEPETFRLVEQYLNQLRYHVPPHVCLLNKYYSLSGPKYLELGQSFALRLKCAWSVTQPRHQNAFEPYANYARIDLSANLSVLFPIAELIFIILH
jgi:hypothetical protein